MDRRTQEFFDKLFGLDEKAAAPVKPTTTDKPDIKLFMLQMINAYAQLATADSMQWEKSFRNKENGKQYTVTIQLRESM
jgi:hypothetical protein